jgi:leucyl aminopeptidase
VPVTGEVPAELGLDRAALEAAGFSASVGSALALPFAGGPTRVAVGVGDAAALDMAGLRDAAAAFARAAGACERLVTTLADAGTLPPEIASQAVVEGALLARYRYDALRSRPGGTALRELALETRADRVSRRLTAGRHTRP